MSFFCHSAQMLNRTLEDIRRRREDEGQETEENRRLKADLHRAQEENGRREEEIASLHQRLSALEAKYVKALICVKGLREEREKAKVDIKERD